MRSLVFMRANSLSPAIVPEHSGSLACGKTMPAGANGWIRQTGYRRRRAVDARSLATRVDEGAPIRDGVFHERAGGGRCARDHRRVVVRSVKK